MSLRSYLKGWPVARVLGGLTVAGSTLLLLTRNIQTSSHMPLMPGQPTAKTAFRRAGPSFLRLRLHSSEDVSPTTKRLRFELPSPDAISGLGLCSAVLTAAWPKGSLFPVVRPYTPVSRLDERGFLELTVKRYPGGKMSTHLHSLAPGDTLLFPGVIPSYQWMPYKHKHVTLIAGGAGVTPVFQLAQGILNNPRDTTKINLVYGVNNDSEILFKGQFAQWQREFPDRFRANFIVRHPDPGSPHEKAEISADLLAQLVPRPEGGDPSTAMVFVCGPPAMEMALVGGGGGFGRGGGGGGFLQQLGYTRGQVFKF